jgi:hypothetical protein
MQTAVQTPENKRPRRIIPFKLHKATEEVPPSPIEEAPKAKPLKKVTTKPKARAKAAPRVAKPKKTRLVIPTALPETRALFGSVPSQKTVRRQLAKKKLSKGASSRIERLDAYIEVLDELGVFLKKLKESLIREG